MNIKIVSEVSTKSDGNTKSDSEENGRNRCRIYAFTLNNYNDNDVIMLSQSQWISNNLNKNIECKKIVFQKEISKTGTPHLQGVVEFKNQVEFSTLKKLHNKIRWSKKNKSLTHNIKYCSKHEKRDPNYKEFIYTFGDVEKELWVPEKKFRWLKQNKDDEINSYLLKQALNHIRQNYKEYSKDLKGF